MCFSATILSVSFMAASILCRLLLSLIAMAALLFLLMLAWPGKMNTYKKFKAFSTKSKKAVLLLLAASCGWAQQQRLTVSPPEQMAIQRGGSATQALKVTIQPGLHVNSDKPKDEYLIPLKLDWENGPIAAEVTSYPKPEQIKVGSEMLSVFTGSFT